jgi:thiamine kinase-like enzyme
MNPSVNLTNSENEIKVWLEKVFEDVTNISVEIVGNSEKGDGFLGDIIFVHVTGIGRDGSVEKYNLVLKCSKNSEMLREKMSMKNVFINEICFYNTTLPTFIRFQNERGVEQPFDSVPKCYGTFIDDNKEIIVLENLKKSGYALWDKKMSMTRKHINMVVEAYGKFHAISVAMKDQEPEKYQQLIDSFKTFSENGINVKRLFGKTLEEVYNLLKGELKEDILDKWGNFKGNLESGLEEVRENFSGLKVITHGDCWNNNFMFHIDNETNLPSNVLILDWQLSKLASPIHDLSYFLFACISEEDLKDLDAVLQTYYESFSNHLIKMGSDPEELYPLNQFLIEWKKYSNYGILFASLIAKMLSLNKDDLPDLAKIAEKGKHLIDAFNMNVKDKTKFKNRMKTIVEFVAENDLI